MDIAFPFRVDASGRILTSRTYNRHIRDLIEQLLFTTPGERVNRPKFGAGLLPIVFKPNGSALADVTRTAVQGALSYYLGDRITVTDVTTASNDSSLVISVTYVVIRTQQTYLETFVRAFG